MLPEIIGSFVRTLLSALAGTMVTHGVIDASATDAVIGTGLGAVTLGWSVYQKYRAKRA